MNKNIPVTRPLLPPLEEFTPYLEQIWSSGQLTNGGQMHARLEQELCEHLGVNHISLFANGTLALITALKASGLEGEVITTPYSYVATSHALLWNGLTPVFVDIDPNTFNIDPGQIERAITPKTSAILAVHCYGNPCDIDAIQDVADRHGLKVIYDAAHAFGVSRRGQPILTAGDLSILSFHATKVFNTFEGGAVVSPDRETKEQVDLLKNFGLADDVTVTVAGFNAKMNEIQAAMGLLQLKYVQAAIDARREVDEFYRQELGGIDGVRLLDIPSDLCWNYAYFALRIDPEKIAGGRQRVFEHLRENDVLVRRYFYPLISSFPVYRSYQQHGLTNAHAAAESVLCLPNFPSLQREEREKVVATFLSAVNQVG